MLLQFSDKSWDARRGTANIHEVRLAMHRWVSKSHISNTPRTEIRGFHCILGIARMGLILQAGACLMKIHE